ncbi:MAG TPA: hypothetical protein VFV99_02840 [Kofleriaceae bacterium]|nr:hypothetical protein [Kofleriaceae bacterium]
MKRLVYIALALGTLGACGNDERHDGDVDAGVDPDPLEVTATAAPGSLDDLHQRIIARSCSGQPGLCHNGQFEPNLSTPALMYAYLVNRPGIEKDDRLRVKPGSAAESLFIDKIRHRNGVATQMPLGAPPLEEEDIAELEAWINAGALREPGAAPAPNLNNPPKRPQIGIFNGTTRLDGAGPVTVSVNTTLTLRHTVHDFETADNAIPFAAVILQIGDGRQIVLDAAAQDPHVGPTTYDAAGPPAQGDVFNYKRTWTIPTTLSLRDPDTAAMSTAPASGQTVTIICVYIDGAPQQDGIVAIEIGATPIQIQ